METEERPKERTPRVADAAPLTRRWHTDMWSRTHTSGGSVAPLRATRAEPSPPPPQGASTLLLCPRRRRRAKTARRRGGGWRPGLASGSGDLASPAQNCAAAVCGSLGIGSGPSLRWRRVWRPEVQRLCGCVAQARRACGLPGPARSGLEWLRAGRWLLRVRGPRFGCGCCLPGPVVREDAGAASSGR